MQPSGKARVKPKKSEENPPYKVARLKKRTEELIREMGDAYYMASQWSLIWRKFRKHKLARVGGTVLVLLYLGAIFCDFVTPYGINHRDKDRIYSPPDRIHIFEGGKLRWPFVYMTVIEIDSYTFAKTYVEDKAQRYPIKLFFRGDKYRFYGLFETDLHLFGVEAPAYLHLFGTDHLGRDLFSRVFNAARISLSIGLVGMAISFVAGGLIGGISGYYGGTLDILIMRVIEFMGHIPHLPLWIALSAALPVDWPVIRVYFGITIILSLIGWTGVAGGVRARMLQIRDEDFCLAARLAGASDLAVIVRHMIPYFMGLWIVRITLAIPGMILGETSLSFLGIGMRPPAVSWGVLLQNAQNIRSVALYPWILIPGLFVVITVLAFNFLGDGLRDAADPYR
jgi:peptide/nickel transport system permease protein